MSFLEREEVRQQDARRFYKKKVLVVPRQLKTSDSFLGDPGKSFSSPRRMSEKN